MPIVCDLAAASCIAQCCLPSLNQSSLEMTRACAAPPCCIKCHTMAHHCSASLATSNTAAQSHRWPPPPAAPRGRSLGAANDQAFRSDCVQPTPSLRFLHQCPLSIASVTPQVRFPATAPSPTAHTPLRRGGLPAGPTANRWAARCAVPTAAQPHGTRLELGPPHPSTAQHALT